MSRYQPSRTNNFLSYDMTTWSIQVMWTSNGALSNTIFLTVRTRENQDIGYIANDGDFSKWTGMVSEFQS